MKPEDYSERIIELVGWQVRVTTYKLGDKYICKADNVSPGANFASAEGDTKDEAESRTIEIAQRRLSRTRQMPV